MNRKIRLAALVLASFITPAVTAADTNEILLVVRADDFGQAQAINEAGIFCFTNGIATSAEVMVPGPWFLDAVRILQAHTNMDVGVHLCLTSEWERCKWRPLTHAPSLVDADGYLRPTTSQRKDFPPDTGFLTGNPKMEEVEAELRAQIETARRHLPRVSHVTAHMGAATATPQLRALTQRLAKEYGLRLEDEGVKYARGFKGTNATERVESLAKLLEELTPGRWALVEHPGLDTPELRAIGHKGYENVATDRAAVTAAYTSDKVKEVIKRKGIRLVGFRDLPRNP